MIVHICGSGNVAWHFAHALSGMLHPGVTAVVSRNRKQGGQLARSLQVQYASDYHALKEAPDICIIAVSDDAIAGIARSIPFETENTVVAHTSGIVPSTVLHRFANHGVLYPLQTLSKGIAVSKEELPLLITGNSTHAIDTIHTVAEAIGSKTAEVEDQARAIYHLAAVFANNFANHMFTLAQDILHDNGLDFTYLHPLMSETLRKALVRDPSDVQTGPARRGDVNTISRHIEMIENPEFREIYEVLTRNIMSMYSYSKEDDI